MSAAPAEKSPQEVAGLVYDSVDSIPQINAELRATFLSGKTRDVNYRKNQLKQLCFLINDNKDALVAAMNKDLGRPKFESVFAEITGTTTEIIGAINNLDKWAKGEKPYAGVAWLTHTTQIVNDPKGAVLVLGAWNYPVSVQIGPVVGAIAAGNTVVLKPSEVSPNTAKLFAELFPKYLDQSAYRIVNGAIPETTALLNQRWEHIFYTGNGTVGRIIAEKAAKWLCPTTLELGGKSPVWVDESADLSIAAHRIFWGKTLNCGQTCIAPDYILCTPATQAKLVAEFQKAYNEFYPDGVEASPNYSRIVNENHWRRLRGTLDQTKGKIVVGGKGSDQSGKLLGPTIVSDCTGDDALMTAEIFGPLLPIVPVPNVDAGIKFINERDQPLALYIFGKDSVIDRVLGSTRSGGVVTGDVLLHYAIKELPFGGTGPSGYGAYHGKHNFLTFTHQRAVVKAPHIGFMGKVVEGIMKMRYPPYTDTNLKMFNLMVGKTPNFSRPKNPHSSVTTRTGLFGSKLRVLALILAVLVAARRATKA